MRYLVVVEETSTGYSAYSPDVPGCVATANRVGDVRTSALAFSGLVSHQHDTPHRNCPGGSV